MWSFAIWFSILMIPITCRNSVERHVQQFVEMVDREIRKTRNFVLPTDASEYKPHSPDLHYGGTFDFVVIGGGATGAPLAARLSEVSEWTTLLLEAGCTENEFADIPAMQGYLKRTKYNWGFYSVPQNSSCLAYEGRRCPQPRGKGLGGTTIINGVLYVRQRPADFQDVFRQGNLGWDYQSVLKYFKRTERCLFDGADKEYHGFDGPMEVQHLPVQSEQSKAFIDANRELGMREVDLNGVGSYGVARMQSNIRNGSRLSTYRGYLEPALKRTNLVVQCNSYVIRIVPFKEKRRVIYVQNGRLFYALARKEIVLSAGSFGTPQILMLSGIGPKEHLSALKIPLVKNLAVGSNLDDHVSFPGMFFSTNLTSNGEDQRELLREYLQGTGRLTIVAGIETLGFYDTPSNDDRTSPSVEIFQMTSPILNDDSRQILELNEETYASLYDGIDREKTFCVNVVGLRPKSKGTVRLASKDPFDYPVIDTRFLTDPSGEDINTIYEGIRLVQRFEQTEAFKRIDAKLIYPELPACRGTVPDSMEYWHCLIRQLGFNIYHPVGTAKMGPNPYNGDVVDSRFKVHGFDSLRVVDASIFPKSFTGHPVAACMMMAEMAYDVIREDHGYH